MEETDSASETWGTIPRGLTLCESQEKRREEDKNSVFATVKNICVLVENDIEHIKIVSVPNATMAVSK